MSGPYDDMIADRTPEGDKTRRMLSNELDQTERNGFAYIWEYLARREQLPPPGDWRVWMIMAGRGFGKTRAGAEWVRMIADSDPEARIALAYCQSYEAGYFTAFAHMAEERFDLIASNPPYIASDDPHLERGDLRFEPATALASGPDGLDDIRSIVFEGWEARPEDAR